jgi:hypothetical protein
MPERLTKQAFIDKANLKHGYVYKYDNINYINSHTKISIICETHKEFEQTPNAHLRGQGCPRCGNIKKGESYSYAPVINNLLVTYPDLCKEWSSKNTRGPEKYKQRSNKKVYWQCKKCNNEWLASINNRTSLSRGCPKCKRSHGEKSIENYLLKNEIKFQSEYRIQECKNVRPLPFDFAIWINEKLYLIEFHGEQHYNTRASGWISC